MAKMWGEKTAKNEVERLTTKKKKAQREGDRGGRLASQDGFKSLGAKKEKKSRRQKTGWGETTIRWRTPKQTREWIRKRRVKGTVGAAGGGVKRISEGKGKLVWGGWEEPNAYCSWGGTRRGCRGKKKALKQESN